MNIKIHEGEDREVVAFCDKDLIGKKFEDDSIVLDINSRFYEGEDVEKEDVLIILKDAINVNIVGKESVKISIEVGIISDDDVREVEGIPYAFYVGI